MLLCTAWTMRRLIGGESPEKLGAIRPEVLWEGHWGALFTSILLHDSGLHLALNMVSLLFVGSVVERSIGRLPYLFFLLASALAGTAASLAWNDGPDYRVGISGGIAGLIGLVLALEWSLSRSFLDFLRQRNTILVLVLLAANAAYAAYSGRIGGAQLDHAGHLGGLALGLVAGLAYYTRRGQRARRGVAVAVLLIAPTLAYAAHPFQSVRYWRYRARTADDDRARKEALETVLRLDPTQIASAAELAELEDDPGILVRALEATLRVDPARIEVAQELAELEGDPGILDASMEARLRQAPDDVAIARVLADRRNDPGILVAALRARLRVDPTSIPAAQQLARLEDDPAILVQAVRARVRAKPGDIAAAAQLAVLEDDPARLESLGSPTRAGDADRVAEGWLQLAARRLAKQPDEARAYADRAAAMRHANPGWLRFGRAAEEAGRTELAQEAYLRAYDAMKASGRRSRIWRPALARLALQTSIDSDLSDPDVFEQRLALATEAAPARAEESRSFLYAFWLEAEKAQRAAAPGDRKRMARALSRFLGALSDGEARDTERRAVMDFEMARLFWLGAEDPTDPETKSMAEGRFGTALQTARRAQVAKLESMALAWFREQGIQPPEPELAEGEDGG